MDVIIIHDRESVASEIARIVSSVDPLAKIDLAFDARSARRLLLARTYDLMVLDLTIPQSLGKDQPSFSNTEALLNEIYVFGDLLAPADLIGISRETEALDLMRSGLGSHFMVSLSEKDDGLWMDQLADRVSYAFRSLESKQTSLSRHFGVDALIVTAMDEEFAPYQSLYDLKKDDVFSEVFRFTFSDKNGAARVGVAFPIGVSGQASAASRTQSLISWFRPRVAVMSGYCGGVKGKVHLGDMCFFDSSAPWDYGKWDETRDPEGALISEEFKSRPNALSIREDDIRRAARDMCMSEGGLTAQERIALKPLLPKNVDRSPEFFLTHAASGSAVVANDRIIAQIRGLNDAIKAVDMESYGFYDACLKTFVAKPKFICMKAVSDFCNGEKGDDYHRYCSLLSAFATRRLLSELVDFP